MAPTRCSRASTCKSGSGKSTLLRCINGLEVFQSGSLTVDGKPLLHDNPAAMRELRQHVGMIFQSFNLFPHLTAGQNIMLAPTLVKKKVGAAAEVQARKLLERVGLAESSATRSPARWTPNSSVRCCAWSRAWPRKV